MRERDKIFGTSTLCWCCSNAVADECGSCRWSRILWPVEGWKTEPGVHALDSVIVKQCPNFKPDKKVEKLAEKCILHEISKPVFIGEFLVNSFVNQMRKLDYDPMAEESYVFILNKYLPQEFNLHIDAINYGGVYEQNDIRASDRALL